MQARINNKTASQVHAKSRERLFSEKPLTAKVQRTSYQDSNIFGYKDQADITVQNSAKGDQRAQRLRQTPTYNSRVFNQVQEGIPVAPHVVDEAVHSPITTRQEQKWMSSVFEGPIIEEVRRKRLDKGDAGQEALFGRDHCEYQSSNVMSAVSGRKTFMKTFVPVRSQKTAEQRKQDEVYGKSVTVYGSNQRSDGTLMANCADWRNPHQTYTNSPVKKGVNSTNNGNAKDRKFGNLESQVVLGDEEKGRLSYNPNLGRATFGSDATWTAQAGTAKLNNNYTSVDTFKKR